MKTHRELLKDIQSYLLYEPLDQTTLAIANSMLQNYFNDNGINCDVETYFYDNQLNFTIRFHDEKDRIWFNLSN